MALVNIINIGVLNNPSSFNTDFQFEIQFECLQSLPEDLDWELTYVGDPESNQRDQVLDEISVGPVVAGMHKFILTTPPPNPSLIRNEDLIGVTAILITCKFHSL